MTLIAFDERKVVGLELTDRSVLRLGVPSTRQHFERAGRVSQTGERLKVPDEPRRTPIRPSGFCQTARAWKVAHGASAPAKVDF